MLSGNNKESTDYLHPHYQCEGLLEVDPLLLDIAFCYQPHLLLEDTNISMVFYSIDPFYSNGFPSFK